uniref:ZNF592-like C2H2 zinc finger domain-containing protein n=1 Tax=Timema genevievae TaxID=629358 RepID=A0A7R9JN65_TIMGE|nr:unnamed protein product [Timema genevievae]
MKSKTAIATIMELVKKKETSAPVVDLPLISDDKQSDKAATEEEEDTRKLPDYHLDSFNKTDSESKEREYLDSDMESDEGDYHGSDDIDIPFSTLADIVGEDLKVAEEMRNARLNSVVDNDSLDNSSTGNAEETELHILDNTIKTKNIPNESQNNTNLTQAFEERKLLLLNLFKINNHSYFKDKKFTSISQENSKIHNDNIERLPNGTRTLCEMSDSNIVDEELSKKTTDSFTDPLSESELLKDIEEITVNEDGEEISTVENESSGVEPNISTSVCSPVASGSSLPVPSKNDRLMDFIMKNTLPTYTADISGFPVPSLLSLQRCVGCNDSFAFQFSLITHLERKTCHITYSCNVCSSTMIFYNRCRLLTHVRNHSDQGKEPILDSSAISFSILKPEDLSTLAKNGSPLTAPNVDNSSSVPTPPEEEQTNPHTTNSKESSSSQVPSSDLQAQAPGQDVEELPHNSLSENLGMQIQNTLEKPPCDKHDNPSRISVKVLNPSDTVEYVQTVESSEGEPSKNTELKICSECKSEVADLRLHFLATNKPLNSTIHCKHCNLQGFGTSVAPSRVNDFPKSLDKRIGGTEKPVVEGLCQLLEVVLDGRHLQVPM